MKAEELTRYRVQLRMNYKEFGQWLSEQIAAHSDDSKPVTSYSRQRVYDWEHEIVAVPAKVEAAILRVQLERAHQQMEKRQDSDHRDLSDDERDARRGLDLTERRLARATDTFQHAATTLDKVLAKAFRNMSAAKAFVEFQLQNNSDKLFTLIQSAKDGDIPLEDGEPLSAFYRLGPDSDMLPILEQAAQLYRLAHADFRKAELEHSTFLEKESDNLSLEDRLNLLQERLDRERARDRDR
ncbi:MAG: hypothetical protein NXH88_17720 [Hyphomonas sp.]|nr:hypothetical protein [Hyphomonas sp.]